MNGAEYPVKRGWSPWDTIEHAYEIAPGIVRVSTCSHGGIWLSAQRIAKLPEWALKVGSGYAPKPVWWEEDCECVVPLFVFREEAKVCATVPSLLELVSHMQHSRAMIEALARDEAVMQLSQEARLLAFEILARPRHPRELAGVAP